jgi:hypothetical protein
VAKPAAVRAWATRIKKRAGASSDDRVVRRIQREAKRAGATLAHGGKGGLDPRLALKVFRRDHWRCSNPKCPTPKKDLDLDHQSGHPEEILQDPKARKDPGDRAAARAGDDPKDDRYLHTLCVKCHDRVHDRERAIEQGKRPKPMRGAAG